jgi:hypothetical protein
MTLAAQCTATAELLMSFRLKAGTTEIVGFDFQTARYASAFPRLDTPELCKNLSPRKSEGAGNAGRSARPQPRVQW